MKTKPNPTCPPTLKLLDNRPNLGGWDFVIRIINPNRNILPYPQPMNAFNLLSSSLYFLLCSLRESSYRNRYVGWVRRGNQVGGKRTLGGGEHFTLLLYWWGGWWFKHIITYSEIDQKLITLLLNPWSTTKPQKMLLLYSTTTQPNKSWFWNENYSKPGLSFYNRTLSKWYLFREHLS